MKDLTVKQLAAISGVTARTLHHFDDIGLLKPDHVGANGYRYYGRAELLRLQRILFHRELGVPLSEIGALLDLEGEDQIAVLEAHRETLAAERERYGVLIETINRTIADMKGDARMSNADLYKGFSAERQAAYEAWLMERYGEPMKKGVEHGRKAFEAMSETERRALGVELQAVEEALAEGLRHGVDPASDAVDGLIRRHRAWVAKMWAGPCEPKACAGLADLYQSHPDFVARYETIAPGFTDYLAAAMRAHAAEAG